MRSLILDVGARVVFHTILLLSVYFLFVGHNAPGGGFIGGLVAGAAFVLRYLALGRREFRVLLPVRPEPVLGVGVLLAVLTGLAGFWIDGAFLASGYVELDVAVLGHVALTSVLVFDTGVYLVVVGLVLMVLDMLGPAERPA